MTLESVKEDIVSAAEAKARQTTEEAKRQGHAILKKAEEEFSAQGKRFEADTKAMIEALMTRERSAANLEGRKLAFEEKRKRIDDVFDAAKRHLAALPQREREKLIEHLCNKAAKEIRIGKVYCNKHDLKLVKCAEAAEAGITGGIIAESEDGLMRVDYSLDTMLAEFRERHLQHVVQILLK